MSNPSTPPLAASAKPVIIAAEPQLFVADITSACEFYGATLGFAVAFTYGDPPFYAQLKRDGARINLRRTDQPPIDPALRDREHLLSAGFTVQTAEEIKQLYREFKAGGATFHQELGPAPWGASNFTVKDIDGNLLLFAGPAG